LATDTGPRSPRNQARGTTGGAPGGCRRTATQVGQPATFDLASSRAWSGGLALDAGRVGAGRGAGRFVDHDLGVRAVDHRRHGQLALPGCADLAHDHEVQRRLQQACHLGTHGDTTAWQCHHHQRPRELLLGQPPGQQLPGNGAIGKWQDHDTPH
jgi:hypothetical protein